MTMMPGHVTAKIPQCHSKARLPMLRYLSPFRVPASLLFYLTSQM